MLCSSLMIASLYTILKNSVVAHKDANPNRRVVQILCDEDDALTLLGAARQVYPEVTRTINAAIDRARES